MRKLNDISVTKKAAAGYVVLAAVTLTATSAFLFGGGQSDHMSRIERIADTLSAMTELRLSLEEQRSSVRRFLITANRDSLAAYEAQEAMLANRFAAIDETLQALSAETGAAFLGVQSDWLTWQREVADRQITLMRDPATATQARLMELLPDTQDINERIDATLASVGSDLTAMARGERAAETAAIGRTRMLVLIGGLLVALFALGWGVLQHMVITRRLQALVRATRSLAGGDTQATVPHTGHADEIGQMADALGVFRQSLIDGSDTRARVEEERDKAAEAKRADMKALAASFEETLGVTVDGVIAMSRELNAIACQLTEASTRSSQTSAGVVRAIGEAGDGVQVVASASEELSASIREIDARLVSSSELSSQTRDRARETNQSVAELQAVVDRIGDVTGLIHDVAEQTNLLALNATIEAARAGDAGKGFAVVASEVKSLAGQTAKATEEIDAQVQQMRSVALTAIEAVQGISGMVEEISEGSASVASSVTQQSASTDEIARSVQGVASNTQHVGTEVREMGQVISEVERMAGDIQRMMTRLETQAETLKGASDTFVAKVQDAA